jgi:ribosomal protein S18 acetylase RimI-like enzyme
MDFNIRKAQPEDGVFLANMIMMAGRNHISRAILEYLLGGKPNDCMTFLQMLLITQTQHLFHHSCYLIAEDSNGPIAIMSGYDPKTKGYQALHQAIPEVSPILGWSVAEQNLVKERTDKLVPSMPEIIDNAWIVDRGATKPESRRLGAAGKLLNEVLATGKEFGFNLAQATIYIGNDPGIKLFEKAGFSVNEEKNNDFFDKMIGAPGMVSLTKGL